jgi:hypothetical protein
MLEHQLPPLKHLPHSTLLHSHHQFTLQMYTLLLYTHVQNKEVHTYANPYGGKVNLVVFCKRQPYLVL